MGKEESMGEEWSFHGDSFHCPREKAAADQIGEGIFGNMMEGVSISDSSLIE